MYRYKQDLTDSTRFVPRKPGAWAVSKSNNYQLSPSTAQQVSKPSKTGKPKNAPTASSIKRATSIVKTDRKRVPDKPNPSELLGVIKTALEEDSQDFNAKLKALEPSIKSLAQVVPKLNPKNRAQPKKQATAPSASASAKVGPDTDVEFGFGLMPPILDGEKLVTVGGYIISLQSTLENISSVIKPRVSSDKDGLELEIKITGCHPSEIKFEKRYNALIVIGVTPSSPHAKEVKDINLKSLTTKKDLALLREHLDEVKEVVNIFVPKNIPLSQIYLSKPDPKGRIYVKGP